MIQWTTYRTNIKLKRIRMILWTKYRKKYKTEED
jgi:hypothetical protein